LRSVEIHDLSTMNTATPDMPAAARSKGGPSRPVTGVSAVLAMAILITTAVFGALDRQILLVLGEPMRLALKMSDTAFGVMQGTGITLFAGIAAIPICWLADRYGRRQVLAVCVLVWALGTAACGLAQNYTTMFFSAMAIGIGEAGLTPIIFGLIPHVVPNHRRVLANGAYAMALLFGTGLGALLSGALVENIDSIRTFLPAAIRDEATWRLALLAVSLPGPVIAALLLFVRESDQSSALDRLVGGTAVSMPVYFRRHWPLVLYVFGGVGLGQLGLLAMTAWVPMAAVRNLGATAAQVGEGLGAAYLISSAAGAVVGGLGAQLMAAKWGIQTPIRVIVVGFLVGAIAAVFLPWTTAPWHMYFLVGVQLAAVVAGSVLAPTLLQDMTPPEARSSILAAGTLLTQLLTSLGPVLVGILSDHGFQGPAGLLLATSAVSTAALTLGMLLLLFCTLPFARAVREFHPELLKTSRDASSSVSGESNG
jgi:MFS family permease